MEETPPTAASLMEETPPTAASLMEETPPDATSFMEVETTPATASFMEEILPTSASYLQETPPASASFMEKTPPASASDLNHSLLHTDHQVDGDHSYALSTLEHPSFIRPTDHVVTCRYTDSPPPEYTHSALTPASVIRSIENTFGTSALNSCVCV